MLKAAIAALLCASCVVAHAQEVTAYTDGVHYSFTERMDSQVVIEVPDQFAMNILELNGVIGFPDRPVRVGCSCKRDGVDLVCSWEAVLLFNSKGRTILVQEYEGQIAQRMFQES